MRSGDMTTDVFDVFVVDPNPCQYGAMAAALAGEGFVFQFASSGHDALRLAPFGSAAFWFINLTLPDMTGYELCELIHGRRPDAVVYFVGDRYRVEDELRCRTFGRTAYVCKPPHADWVRQGKAAVRPRGHRQSPLTPG